jgi:hypothetical protein
LELYRLHPLFGSYGNGSQSRGDINSVRIEHQFVTDLEKHIEKAHDKDTTGCRNGAA